MNAALGLPLRGVQRHWGFMLLNTPRPAAVLLSDGTERQLFLLTDLHSGGEFPEAGLPPGQQNTETLPTRKSRHTSLHSNELQKTTLNEDISSTELGFMNTVFSSVFTKPSKQLLLTTQTSVRLSFPESLLSLFRECNVSLTHRDKPTGTTTG